VKNLISSAALILIASASVAPRGRTVLEPTFSGPHGAGSVVTQSACVEVLPAPPVAVAPGQPAIGSEAAATPNQAGVKIASPTAGIINALCDVTLDIVGCDFSPNQVTLGCDTSGDGVPDLLISLTNVTTVDANLTQATLSVTQSGLAGSPFPLSCCGGFVVLTLQLSVSAGDNNIFGPFTLTQTCNIDVGQRAPVVISASPSEVDCSTPQDILIPGSCFILPDGVSNVTSVFAVDTSDPANVIQAANDIVLTPNLIDAVFNFGAGNAGKVFMIFVSGPNGTSRNLAQLPEGIEPTCPLGNEQGIQVTVNCEPPPQQVAPTIIAVVNGCLLTRSPAGKETLTVTGSNIQQNASVTVSQGTAKSVTFSQFVSSSNTYNEVLLKGAVCKLLPGPIVITNPQQPASIPFQCNKTCP
jgi:hypothetical protein